MGIGILKKNVFNILVILEVFFLDKRRFIYTGKYDLLISLIKGSISSNRS